MSSTRFLSALSNFSPTHQRGKPPTGGLLRFYIFTSIFFLAANSLGEHSLA